MHLERETRVLIFGISGMLGSAIYRTLSDAPNLAVFGTVRAKEAASILVSAKGTVIEDINVDSEGAVLNAFSVANPDIVINCVGIIKQKPDSKNHYESILINSMLPHRLAKYCSVSGAKLVHFSTDCVFTGMKGDYSEGDVPDAFDLYGRSKLLGEVSYSNSITLRTSIIGHELFSNRSLIDWFLSQRGKVKGYRKAVFSGLPTNEVARIIRDIVIPNDDRSGLYHLSVRPINKYDLLTLVSDIYDHRVELLPDDELIIDRSLNSDRFRQDFHFNPRPWPDLIEAMHNDYLATRL